MKSLWLPKPLAWSLLGSALFWIANMASLDALTLNEVSPPTYFISRYLACVLAAVPVAAFGRFTARGFAIMFVLPCIAVLNGYAVWNSKGLEIWPAFAILDLICFLPSMCIYVFVRNWTGHKSFT